MNDATLVLARLAPVPRALPASLRLRMRLGGGWTFAGWVLLALAAPLFWIYGGGERVYALVYLSRDTVPALADITRVAPVPGRMNRQTWYRVEYAYDVDGTRHAGWVRNTVGGSESGKLAIAYAREQPERSLPRELPWPSWMCAVAALLGVALIGRGWLVVAFRIALLRRGRAVPGRYVAGRDSGVQVGGKKKYLHEYTFEDLGGNRHQVVGDRWHDSPDADLVLAAKPVLVLHHQGVPEAARVFDPAPALDARGEFVGDVGGLLRCLVGPALFVAANVALAWLRLA